MAVSVTGRQWLTSFGDTNAMTKKTRKWLIVGLLLAVVVGWGIGQFDYARLVVGKHPTFALPARTYVGYDFFETRHTKSDDRECMTQVYLADYVGYRYREDVFGATTPAVRSIAFSNEYSRKATDAEQAELMQSLLVAKVFELASETKTASNDYFGNLDVRVGTRETRLYFYSPPESPRRRAVHDVILRFAHKMKIDQPTDPATATTITEGDLQPALAVKLADVLADPGNYQGKRISVVGFYHGEFEGSSLSIDQATSQKREYKHSVWRSGASTFADHSLINDKNDSWMRVEGIFLRGPTGHLGLWPGEIIRLTRIEPMSEAK